MNLFESLSLKNVRHIIHQRLYTKPIQQSKNIKKNARKEHNLKPKKSQMGAYYTLIIV